MHLETLVCRFMRRGFDFVMTSLELDMDYGIWIMEYGYWIMLWNDCVSSVSLFLLF